MPEPTPQAKPGTTDLGQQAWAHVQALADGIGPRPAGSPAEEQAGRYAAQTLEALGYRPQLLPAPFAPASDVSLEAVLAGLGLALAGGMLLMPVAGLSRLGLLLGLCLPLLLAGLPDLQRIRLNRRAAAGPAVPQAQNVLAWAPAAPGPAAGAPVPLLLCAHLDTAPTLAFQPGPLRGLYDRTLDLAQRAAIATAALSALRLLGFSLPGPLAGLVAGAAGLAGLWLAFSSLWNDRAGRGRYAPGANDNASGVGALLALAAWAAGRPFRRLQLGFLFTAAEETGLHGARAFAPQAAETPGLQVLCLDMVGTGDALRFARQDGVFFPARPPAHWQAWITAVEPGARPLSYTHRSGDFAAFLRAGISATNLEVTGNEKDRQAYHSLADTPERVSVSALQLTTGAVVKLIEALERGDFGENLFSLMK